MCQRIKDVLPGNIDVSESETDSNELPHSELWGIQDGKERSKLRGI
jgi:hypothetical protein